MNAKPASKSIQYLWGAVLLIMATGSSEILESWLHDPRARFSGWAFLLWLGACGGRWRNAPPPWPPSTLVLAIGSGMAGALGILGELNALLYLGFAGWALCPIRSFPARLFGAVGALFWMPVFPWLVSEPLGAATPWVSAGVVALFSGALWIVSTPRTHESETNHRAP